MNKIITTTIMGLAIFAMTGCNFLKIGDKGVAIELSRTDFINEGLDMMSKCTEAQLAVSALTIKIEKNIQGEEKEEYSYVATIKDSEWEYSKELDPNQALECSQQCVYWETNTLYKVCNLMNGEYGADKLKGYKFQKLANGEYVASGSGTEFTWNSSGLLKSHKTVLTSSSTTRTYIF